MHVTDYGEAFMYVYFTLKSHIENLEQNPL